MRTLNGRRWTDDEIRARIERWYRDTGRLPCAEEWQKPGNWPNYKTFCRRYGSWAKGMELLGFSARMRGEWLRTEAGGRPSFEQAAVVKWQRWCAGRTTNEIEEARQRALLDPKLRSLVIAQIRDDNDRQWPQTIGRSSQWLPPDEVDFEVDLPVSAQDWRLEEAR